MHDAFRVRAMAEAVGMSDFMNSLLDNPLLKEAFILWKSIEFLPKPYEGYNGHLRKPVSLSKDKVEFRHIEVHISDTDGQARITGMPISNGNSWAEKL